MNKKIKKRKIKQNCILGEEEIRKLKVEVNLINVYYIDVWKYHDETPLYN
jgi:hypothetical protein